MKRLTIQGKLKKLGEGGGGSASAKVLTINEDMTCDYNEAKAAFDDVANGSIIIIDFFGMYLVPTFYDEPRDNYFKVYAPENMSFMVFRFNDDNSVEVEQDRIPSQVLVNAKISKPEIDSDGNPISDLETYVLKMINGSVQAVKE